jgi:hypothetical protein
MITYICPHCGLKTKDTIYMKEDTDNDCVSLHCEECNNEVVPDPEVLVDPDKCEELENEIHELALDFHKKEIYEALHSLIADGIVEVAGVDENGEEYYELSDKGRAKKILEGETE